MILSDFRYQDPWSEEKFTLPDFVRQGQAQQRYDQQEEINHKTLDTLLAKLSQRDIVGVDHAKEYLRHKYRQNCRANTLKNDFTTITLFLSYLKRCGRSELNQISRADFNPPVLKLKSWTSFNACCTCQKSQFAVFTGIIADTYITGFSVLSKAERYRTRPLNHQACQGGSPKDVFKSKGFFIKRTLFH
jgi:hypothetical protein